MNKEDIRLLAYAAVIYIVIATSPLIAKGALISLAAAIFVVATGLSLYCQNRVCIFTK
jgi:hypothetical protein